MATQTQKYNKLAGKHVLIIGGTSGILPFKKPNIYIQPSHLKGLGYAVAEACIESSAHITISSSSPSKITTSISTLKSSYPSTQIRISGHACDLSLPTLEQEIESLFEKTGKVDHVVFTAGDPLAITPLNDITYEKMIRAGQIRFFAPMLVAKVGKRYLNPGPESSITLTTGAIAQRPNEGVRFLFFYLLFFLLFDDGIWVS